MNSELSDLSARSCDAETFAFRRKTRPEQKGAGAGESRGTNYTPVSESSPAKRLNWSIPTPGTIQSIWIGGYPGSTFILRMYWDSQEYPSVEAPLPAFLVILRPVRSSMLPGKF